MYFVLMWCLCVNRADTDTSNGRLRPRQFKTEVVCRIAPKPNRAAITPRSELPKYYSRAISRLTNLGTGNGRDSVLDADFSAESHFRLTYSNLRQGSTSCPCAINFWYFRTIRLRKILTSAVVTSFSIFSRFVPHLLPYTHF